MSNPLELMTKTQIMREYGLPGTVIASALASGELKSAVNRTTTYEFEGKTRTYENSSRLYIPRIQVENLIRKRVGMPEVEL